MHIVRTSGALTTDGVVASGTGILSFAQAGAGAVNLYDGLTAAGDLIATLPSSVSRSWDNGVKYNDGLFITVASGTAVIHGTNVNKTT
jgi:hypothetical protein